MPSSISTYVEDDVDGGDASNPPWTDAKREGRSLSFVDVESQLGHGLAPRQKTPSDDAILTHEHVKAIEAGQFIYDPTLVQKVIDVGQRLANLDHYVCKDPYTDEDGREGIRMIVDKRMTKVLLGDVEDFLQVVSRVVNRMDFLHEYHEDAHIDVMENALREAKEERATPSSSWSTVLGDQLTYFGQSIRMSLGLNCYPARYYKTLDKKYNTVVPRRFALPHTFERRRRTELYGFIYEACLELANLGSDVLFIVTQLFALIGTWWGPLFHVAVGALALTFLSRLVIGLAHYKLVDWKDKRRVQKYFIGIFVGLIEPISGFNDFIKRSFKVQESLGKSVIGDSIGTSVKDEIATQAKADYGAARMSILTAMVLLLQDIPLLSVEILYIFFFKHGDFGFVYYIALFTSLLSAARQFFEAYKLLQDIPGLRNLMFVRHLVLNPSNDKDYEVGEAHNDKGQPKYVGAALEAFFDYKSRGTVSDKNWISLKVANMLVKILFIPVTFGTSLFWRSANKYSWAAYAHFHDTLMDRVILTGKPFTVAKVNRAERNNDEDAAPATCGGDLFATCFSRSGKTAVRTQSSYGISSLSLLFNRMDSKTLHQSVRSIDLTDCSSVSDANLGLVAKHCPVLQNLNLSFCVQVTDAGLLHFRHCKCIALGSITLDACTKVTDEGVRHMIETGTYSIWNLSLRSLPKITAEVFSHIGDHCPNLRSLALDVDLVYKEFASSPRGSHHGVSFLSVRRDRQPQKKTFMKKKKTRAGNVEYDASEAFLDMMKSCTALRDLSLNDVMDDFDDYEALAELINPFLRTLSLAGAKRLTLNDLQGITSRTPHLRKLVVARATQIESVEEAIQECHRLRSVRLGGTRVSMEEADRLLQPGPSKFPDLQVVLIDHHAELSRFYTKQLGLQLRRYHASYEKKFADAPSPPAAIQDVHEQVLNVEGQYRVFARMRAEDFDARDRRAMDVLSGLVGLVDYVRRARERLEYSEKDLSAWSKLVTDREAAQGERLVQGVHDTLQGKDVVPRKPAKTPFLSLPSFGVISTRRVNMNFDFETQRYEFICPPEFREAFVPRGDEDAAEQMKFVGRISPLSSVTLNRSVGATKRLLRRYWAIPPEARYYCFAYPADGLGVDTNLDFREDQRKEDAGRRFLHFGGYFYFDVDRNFLGLSALTFGTVLSFNGPFELTSRTIEDLEERWHPVTIPTLMPDDAETVDFCYIYRGETVLKDFRDKIPHGCFAYRFTPKGGGPARAFIYSITTVSQAILEDPQDEQRGPEIDDDEEEDAT